MDKRYFEVDGTDGMFSTRTSCCSTCGEKYRVRFRMFTNPEDQQLLEDQHPGTHLCPKCLEELITQLWG